MTIVPTSLDFLHALAEETGEYGSFTTTGAGTTSSLICSKLVNTALAASEFANCYVLIESGDAKGEVGQAKTLVRSTGALSTSDTFSASIASGVTFTLYRVLPPIDGDNILPSYLKVINLALRRLWVPYRISLSGVTGQTYYTVNNTTYPWWTDRERIIRIEYPVTNADDVPRVLRETAWDWDANGETRRLVFPGEPFKTGETFYVWVYRPANSYLKKNGTWTDQTSQTAEMALYTSGTADEALADVADVVTMATALLYRALSRIDQPSAQVAEWLAKAQPAYRAARALQHIGIPEDRHAGVHRMRPVRSRYVGA